MMSEHAKRDRPLWPLRLAHVPTRSKPSSSDAQKAQFTASFNLRNANALTLFDAGLALNTQGSFVKGLTPLRAGVAGLLFSFSLIIWPNLKAPDFFSSAAPTSQ